MGYGATRAVERPGDDDRELRLELELALDEQRRAGGSAEAIERAGNLGLRADPELAPAVVAADRDLEAEGRPELRCGSPELALVGDLAPGCRRDPERGHEPALGEPILRHPQGERARAHGHAGGLDRVDQRRVHVLELVGDDVGCPRQLDGAGDGLVPRDDDALGHGGGRTVGVGVQDDDPVP